MSSFDAENHPGRGRWVELEVGKWECDDPIKVQGVKVLVLSQSASPLNEGQVEARQVGVACSCRSEVG